MTEELVLLECITDNQYQPRTTDNAEHIENLARGCKAVGVTLPKGMAKMDVEFDAQIAAAGVAAETEDT